MRSIRSILFLSEFLSHWVHPSVPRESDAYNDHARFIGFHVLGGILALLLLPLLVVIHGKLSAEAGVFLSFISLPLFLAWFVSKTAQLQWALRGTLALGATGLCFLCLSSGTMASPFLIWFSILSIESALLGGRSALVAGIGATFLGLAFLVLVSLLGSDNFLVTQWMQPEIAHSISMIAMLIYGGLLAVRLNGKKDDMNKQIAVGKDTFQVLAENTADLITRHSENGETLFASPASFSLLGVTAQEMLHTGFLDKVHVQDRVVFLNSLKEAACQEQDQACEFRLKCKSEGAHLWKWVEMRSRSVVDEQTGQVDVISVTRDMSEQKANQQALSEARQAAEQCTSVQRGFLTTMSHELRTPLNAIIGFADVLKQEVFGKLPDERCGEYVDLIHASGEHLLTMVNDLLDVSRIEAGKYELSPIALSMVDVINDTIAMLEPLITQENICLTTCFEDDLPLVYADQRACQQILINLLSNAVKFSAEQQGVVHVALTHDKNQMRLAIEDNGIGMSRAFIDSLGQPFMQADMSLERKYAGSGLGMFVVMGLVRLHDGKIDIDSTEGQGTCITVTFPLKSLIPNPVPADVEKHIVLLNEIANAHAPREGQQDRDLSQSKLVNQNEGDRRVRRSA